MQKKVLALIPWIGAALVGAYVVSGANDDAPPPASASAPVSVPNTHAVRVAQAEIERLTSVYPPSRDVTWSFIPMQERGAYGVASDNAENLIEISTNPRLINGPRLPDEEIRRVVRHELAHQITFELFSTSDWEGSATSLAALYSAPEGRDGWEHAADVIGATLAPAGTDDRFSAAQLREGREAVSEVTSLTD